jgi:uncharacterized protein YegP (UPF0339 family)
MQKLRIKRIEHFRSSENNQFYVRIIGLNGKTVFPSEGYHKRSGRDNAIAIVNQSLIAPVPVVEVPCPHLKAQKKPARVKTPAPVKKKASGSKSASKAKKA